MEKEITCRTAGCSKEVAVRGVCRACYASVAKWISEGHGTMKQLEEAGIVAPATTGKTRKSPMSQTLAAVVNDGKKKTS